LLYIFGLEYTVGLGKELARRVFGYQRDDLRAFFLGEAWPPTGAGTVAESVHPCEIEPVEALSDGLWMTAELLGDLEGTQPLPTQRDDTGTEDQPPVACRLLASLWTFCSFPASCDERARGRFGTIFTFSVWRFGRTLMCSAFKERSNAGAPLVGQRACLAHS
jgi:hypothetical protein